MSYYMQQSLTKIALDAFMILFLLKAVSGQSCTSERFYCGHQVLPIAFGTQKTRKMALWQCESGGKSLSLSNICNFGCKDVEDGDSYCLCLQNNYYCGHELNKGGWKTDKNSLYYCTDDGLNASQTETCSVQCIESSQSYCFNHECKYGQNYCGYILKEIGFDGYENDTLYQCLGRNETRVLSKCPPGKCHSDYCECNPSRYYCGHELHDQLGWGELKSRRTELFKCGLDGTGVFDFNRFACQECINGDQLPNCECKIGNTYCGSFLREQGWHGYENDTLYLCEGANKSSNLIEQMPCGVGKCGKHSCGCTRDKLYCGHELYQMGWGNLTSDKARSLYRCTNGTTMQQIVICSVCHNTGVGSRCGCPPANQYCGHELLNFGWEGYENHSIYECADNDLNATLIDTCSVLCKVVSNRRPFCFRECRDGQNYCGYRMKEMGWDGYENDTLYQCHGGNEMRFLSKCPPGTCNSDSCLCNPGQYYCGHEMIHQLGSTNRYYFESKRLEDLFKCDSNRIHLIYQYRCDQCISGERGARCACETGGTYCGYTLQTMGWDGYDTDTMYFCEKGQNESHVTELAACESGKCRQGREGANCECTLDKLYCGHQLFNMGWRIAVTTAEKKSWLSRCTNGSIAVVISICKNCYHNGTLSKCECSSGNHYCGHELLEQGWEGYENDTLYHCDGSVNVKTIKTCHSECIKVKAHSFCGGDCVQSTMYCGSKINQMGYQGYNNDSIYLCKDSVSPLVDTRETNLLCSHDCIPGRSYCGYELQYIQTITKDDLQRRYMCNDDKTFQSASVCGRCITTNATGAYCYCVPGWRHCASIMYTPGWKGFGESLATANLPKHFTNDTIFQCKDEEKIEYVESCGRNECKYKFIGGAYCVCSPNRTYCGHELNEHYNSMETKLDPNYIYKCSETTSTVIIQERCRKCLSLYGMPICRIELSTPWFVGGIVGGIAALVVFTLGFLLIRTIIKHRRFKKLKERKRIDVTQLTVRKKKLGQGEFGEVWKGTYINSEGNELDVALKLSKGRIDATNCFLQEVMTLDVVSHQNIIKVFGVCLNFIDEARNSVPALVLEYMNGGSAISYMRSERNRLNGQDLLHIFLDICQAGDHLCKLHFIHRDIAARNVLVQKNPESGHVTVAKLTDFGLARDIGKLAVLYKDTNHDQTRLPFRYLAPEGFERCFCFKSDVWSFGVFMWELYTVMEEEDVLTELRLEQGRSGPVPYSELKNVADVLAEACSERKLKQPRMAPEKMYKIMRQCWAVKLETRPTFEELIKSFNVYGNGNIIEPPVTFLPTVSSVRTNGACKGKENSDEEKDNQHDQDMYAAP